MGIKICFISLFIQSAHVIFTTSQVYENSISDEIPKISKQNFIYDLFFSPSGDGKYLSLSLYACKLHSYSFLQSFVYALQKIK